MADTRTSDEEIKAIYAASRRAYYKLCLAYENAWRSPGVESGLGIPPEVAATYAPRPVEGIERLWSVAEASLPRLSSRARGAKRLRDAEEDRDAARVAGNSRFVMAVESVTMELGNRLVPWFGTLPVRFEWVVTRRGEPNMMSRAYWLDTAGWSAELALEVEGIATVFKPEPVLPSLWTSSIVYALQWDLAVAYGLTVPRNFRPPHAIADRPFAGLANPFRPLIDLWRCGAMLAAPFDKSDANARLFVNAEALPSRDPEGRPTPAA